MSYTQFYKPCYDFDLNTFNNSDSQEVYIIAWNIIGFPKNCSETIHYYFPIGVNIESTEFKEKYKNYIHIVHLKDIENQIMKLGKNQLAYEDNEKLKFKIINKNKNIFYDGFNVTEINNDIKNLYLKYDNTKKDLMDSLETELLQIINKHFDETKLKFNTDIKNLKIENHENKNLITFLFLLVVVLFIWILLK